MRELTFEVVLREGANLPMDVIVTEARQKLWELLWQHLDIAAVTYIPPKPKKGD